MITKSSNFKIEDLDQYLSLVIVFGEELILIEEMIKIIVSYRQKQGFVEYVRFHITGNSDWLEVQCALNNLSLFSDNKLLLLRLPTGKISADGEYTLHQASVASNVTVVMMIEELNWEEKKRKWFRELSEKNFFIECSSLLPIQFLDWIQKKAQFHGMSFTSTAAELLVEYFWGNLLEVKQVIDKLCLTYLTGELDVEQVEESIDGLQQHYKLEEITIPLLRLDYKNCLRYMLTLQDAGVPSSLLLWRLSEDVLTLIQMNELSEKNFSFSRISSQLRLCGQRRQLFAKHYQQFSLDILYVSFSDFLLIDMSIKGMSGINHWHHIAQWLKNWCQRSV